MKRPRVLAITGASILAVSLLVLLNIKGKHVFAQADTFDLTGVASYQFHTLRAPTGLIVEESSSSGLLIYIADTGNNLVRLFFGNQLVTFAGNGTAGYVNGPLASAEFNRPTGLAGGYYTENFHGTIYNWHYLQVNDTNNFVVRDICAGSPPPTGPNTCNTVQTATTHAGNGIQGLVNGSSSAAEFGHLSGLMGSWYIADSDNNVIRRLSGSTVSTYAGTGTPGLVNGPLTTAQFNTPTKVIADSAGNLFVVDAGNHCIRKITTSGNVSTFAGSGQPGYADGSATTAQFYRPTSIIYNAADGYYYVADTFNNCIRRIDSAGNVTTYAGAQTAGYQDGALLSARFNKPTDVGIANGYMYVSDTSNNAIRQINMAQGTVTTFID